MTPDQVRLRLLALPFPDYVARVALLMARMGYREVRPLGPLHEKGRNAYGAHDIRAAHVQGLARSTVIAQAKQYRQPVPRSFVDELRGAMLRTGAQQGLLFTTSDFARSAVEAAQAGQYAAPVRLVTGEELARLMLAYGIDADGTPPSSLRRITHAEADEMEREFMAGLAAPRMPRGRGPRLTAAPTPVPGGRCPRVSVTVLIRPQTGASDASHPSRP